MKRVLVTMLATFLVCWAVMLILAAAFSAAFSMYAFLVLLAIVVASGVIRYVLDRRQAEGRT